MRRNPLWQSRDEMLAAMARRRGAWAPVRERIATLRRLRVWMPVYWWHLLRGAGELLRALGATADYRRKLDAFHEVKDNRAARRLQRRLVAAGTNR